MINNYLSPPLSVTLGRFAGTWKHKRGDFFIEIDFASNTAYTKNRSLSVFFIYNQIGIPEKII
jgi:hypothetical protein